MNDLRLRFPCLVSLFSAIAAMLLMTPAFAQPDFLWVKRFGGSGRDTVRGVATDPAGDVVVTGFFEGTANFEGTTLTSAGGTDIFVAKLSPDGALRWVRRAGGSDPARVGGIHDSSDAGWAVATDAVGNIYVTGGFLRTADFAGRTIRGRGDRDAFLIKYAPDGAMLWVRTFGGGGTDTGTHVAVNGAHVAVTGFFEGTLVIGGEAVSSRGGLDFFVARFDTDGALQWVRSAGSGNDDAGTGVVTLRSGSVFASGYFKDSVDFGGASVSSAGQSDIFAARYLPDASLDWLARGGGTGTEDGTSLAYDGTGNLFATGAFQTPANFGASVVTGVRGLNAFVTRVNAASGAFVWASALVDGDGRGPNDVRGIGITVDAEGAPVTAGVFTGTVAVDDASIESAGGTFDIFIARHQANDGTLSWLKRAGGPGDDRGWEVAADDDGNIYAGGFFSGTASFDTLSVTSRGRQDAFIAKLGERPPPTPGPVEGDRFEPNDTPGTAARLPDGWEHIHELCPRLVRRALHDPDLRCPRVWEDAAVAPDPPSRGTLEIWRLRVEDLSIGEGLGDRNFYSVRLPDPQRPADGGPHDIRTTGQVLRGEPFEPMPECDAVERIEIAPDGRDNTIFVNAAGTLTITVIPTANDLADRPVSTGGESIHMYTGVRRTDDIASGTPLTKVIECPRSARGLTEIAFSFGERSVPRTDTVQIGGYTLLLEYVIDIERETPEWALDEFDGGGAGRLPGLPCLGGPGGFGGFPFPLPRFPDCVPFGPGIGHLDFEPFPPDCLADGPGCFGLFLVRWPDTQVPFDMSFFTPFDAGEAHFVLRDALGQVIGEAKPIEHLQPISLKEANAPIPFTQPRSHLSGKTLRIDQLPAGRYYLGIKGPPVRYRMEFTPLPVTDSPLQQTPVQK